MDNARALAGRLRERARYDTAVDPLKLLIEAADLLDRLAAPEGVGLTRFELVHRPTRTTMEPSERGTYVRHQDAAAVIADKNAEAKHWHECWMAEQDLRDKDWAERDALKAALDEAIVKMDSVIRAVLSPASEGKDE